MKLTTLIGATVLSLATIPAQAAVITFTPAGGAATVSQSTDLYWNMLSNATATSNQGWVAAFSLSGHGDFHFNGGDMVKIGSTDGGDNLAAGTLIGASSNFGTNFGYAGTDAYNGECVRGATCLYGLKFTMGGNTHYGWVKFAEGASTQSLLGWGYENVAGRAIAAGITANVPEPTSIALLGMGLCGLLAARRKRQG